MLCLVLMTAFTSQEAENADLQWEFHKLPVTKVDIERGVATINIKSTGIYYICSSSAHNMDFAVHAMATRDDKNC